MQRYTKFNREEQENAEFLLRAYPDLQIAYLEEEPARTVAWRKRARNNYAIRVSYIHHCLRNRMYDC